MDKGDRCYDDDVHGLQYKERRRINLTAEASRSMDGWERHRAQQTAPEKNPKKKSSAARILVLLLYPRRAEGVSMDAPPRWSTQYKVQPHTEATRAHTRT